ncbi:LOW QUALITY PROTEIN: SAMD11 isoform 7 [Pan troglodytes]|uniref:SAMD11 isoform 7 n=1 Tax=Pan troglodytes TaxID=9598 RepID=A0A2J8IP54_PANTR|nr:LOW QUALITY PROTEIN: SAMD11 isoform 7 [Pan troglodytes]
MSKGILQVHPPICDCPGCRISSPVNRGRLADKRTVALPAARNLKKERTPSFSASDGDSDGSGPTCGRRPGLKQEDGRHVRIMKRRVHTHWDVNISFREASCRLRFPARPGGDVRPAAGAPAEAEPGPAGAARRPAAAEGAGERAPTAAGARDRPAPQRRRRGAAAARGPAGAEPRRGATAGPAPPGAPGLRTPHPVPGLCPASPPERGSRPCLSAAQRVQGDDGG